jgi:hypothetical protein
VNSASQRSTARERDKAVSESILEVQTAAPSTLKVKVRSRAWRLRRSIRRGCPPRRGNRALARQMATYASSLTGSWLAVLSRMNNSPIECTSPFISGSETCRLRTPQCLSAYSSWVCSCRIFYILLPQLSEPLNWVSISPPIYSASHRQLPASYQTSRPKRDSFRLPPLPGTSDS